MDGQAGDAHSPFGGLWKYGKRKFGGRKMNCLPFEIPLLFISGMEWRLGRHCT